MLLIDPQNGNIIDANGAATRFYGYSVVELVGTTLQEITSYANENIITELKQNIQSKQDFLVFQRIVLRTLCFIIRMEVLVF